jgi:hypothetical protein
VANHLLGIWGGRGWPTNHPQRPYGANTTRCSGVVGQPLLRGGWVFVFSFFVFKKKMEGNIKIRVVFFFLLENLVYSHWNSYSSHFLEEYVFLFVRKYVFLIRIIISRNRPPPNVRSLFCKSNKA